MKMNLTDAACRQKPRPKPFKAYDGGGLYLLIYPDGTRGWRLRYNFAGREKLLSFGAYPTVPLADARTLRDAARGLIAKGIDPSQQRKEDKIEAASAQEFGAVAEEWFRVKMVGAGKAKAEATQIRNGRLIDHIKRDPIGKRPIGEIDVPELLVFLRKHEANGFHESVARLRSVASRIFRFGIASGICKSDPAHALGEALITKAATPRPAITKPKSVSELMRKIDGYDAGRGPLARMAMQFLALTWVRPGEQRKAEWSEFDIANRLWSIPADKMKRRLPHEVPLSRQAVALLAELRPLTGHGRYVFSFNDKPMSDGTINAALQYMAYDTTTQHCAHGFRAMASTLMNAERHKDGSPVWEPDAIELCLAHVDDSTPRGIYNRAKLMPERIRIMQHYADKLDMLRDGGAQVVPLKRKPV